MRRGANNLIMGSSIFNSKNPYDSLRYFNLIASSLLSNNSGL